MMLISHTSDEYRTRAKGFALVITLIMVALAAVIVVALLTNATLDRTTSKSLADRFQAEIAAKNALEAAKKALIASPSATTSVVADDTYIVLRNDGTQGPSGDKDAYYFLAKAKPRDANTGISNAVDCYPLFSGGTLPPVLVIDHAAYPPLQRPAVPTAPFPTNPAEDSTGKYPRLLPFQQPVFTQWQEIRDPNDTAPLPGHNLPYQRYTYWVEDLSGYLDSASVGNTLAAGDKHQRNNGTSPNEIALFTLFDSALNADSGSTLAKTLVMNRPLLFTGPTLAQIAVPLPTGKTDVTQPNMATGFGSDVDGEQNLIPFGFGFLDEGKVKTNLNTIIQDTTTSDVKVTTLATAIDTNLPQFAALRKGALPVGEDYSKTLAASIIDYADTDSTPTLDVGYRGIDAYPMVVQFFDRFNWESHTPSPVTNYYAQSGTWWADVRMSGYIQLWNMTNKTIDSGTLQFTDINRYAVQVGSNQYKVDDNSGSLDMSTSSLDPNAFTVFKFFERVYNFDSGVSTNFLPPNTSSSPIRMGQQDNILSDHTESGYVAAWDGKTTERAGSGALDGSQPVGTSLGPNTTYPGLNFAGIQRQSARLKTAQSQLDPSWRGSIPGLRYDDLSETTWNLGDPRSGYYISKIQANAKYAKRPSDSASALRGSSAWFGRMYQTGLIEDSAVVPPWSSEETLVANWPDGDHTTGKGLLPTSSTIDPFAIPDPRPITEPDKAPVMISNSGTFASISELGRIYDPAQWRPAAFPVSGSTTPPKPTSSSDVATKWKEAWKNDLQADPNYGIGSTLRIGTPEFKQFDNDDARAARLTDLFGITDRITTQGLVNLNTAGREALRALAAGIQLTNDAAIAPTNVYGPVIDPANPIQADKFADAVIANRPFLSTSQLAGILITTSDNTSKFFGNDGAWISGGPTEWTDSAREEYFSRLFDLTAVRSRNFRVFVTGQALDKTGIVLSTVNRVYQVFVQPTRDSAGKITNQSIKITYEKDI